MTPSMLVSQIQYIMRGGNSVGSYTESIKAVEAYTAQQAQRIAELEFENARLREAVSGKAAQ